MNEGLATLSADLIACTACPRLVAWREQVARERRAAYADETYWGSPVPGFGDPDARIVVVGLAPGAHGANRTGRMFTGDRSGAWLFRSLWRAGFSNQPDSTHLDDGLQLTDVWITGAVRCAPPANRPSPTERDACGRWLDAELALLAGKQVIVCLGQFAYVSVWRALRRLGMSLPVPRPAFAHGALVRASGVTLLAGYHPSQQNTFTGKLTEEMFDGLFEGAREALDTTGLDECTP